MCLENAGEQEDKKGQSTNFHTFKHICQDILTVIFSETEDIEIKNYSFSCFGAQQRLITRIKTQDLKYNEDFLDDDDDDGNDNNSSNFDSECSSCMKYFLVNLETKSKTFINSENSPNPQYCHNYEYVKNFLCGKLLLHLKHMSRLQSEAKNTLMN
ncbi:hypothetical protein PV327_004126 [Microctonus hyperodae]|uniref:Uncharacterized protein n=1 Tax=Microctonus hyperodae TaxID=165561 RepID=A0AA39FBR3_MICHY|nr:hypothetical protein PV327_004126 [Microctonus hyperodae]